MAKSLSRSVLCNALHKIITTLSFSWMIVYSTEVHSCDPNELSNVVTPNGQEGHEHHHALNKYDLSKFQSSHIKIINYEIAIQDVEGDLGKLEKQDAAMEWYRQSLGRVINNPKDSGFNLIVKKPILCSEHVIRVLPFLSLPKTPMSINTSIKNHTLKCEEGIDISNNSYLELDNVILSSNIVNVYSPRVFLNGVYVESKIGVSFRYNNPTSGEVKYINFFPDPVRYKGAMIFVGKIDFNNLNNLCDLKLLGGASCETNISLH